MATPAWALDGRWSRAQQHAQRGEVLQAELLLRALAQDHPSAVPVLEVLADFAGERGDWPMACGFLEQALRHAPGDAELPFRLARSQAAGGQLDLAKTTLEQLIAAHPSHDVARLMLADVLDAHGQPDAALRTRYQVITQAQKAGRWTSEATVAPELLQTVLRQIERLRRQQRETYLGAYDAVRQAHGAASVERIDRAARGYLGEITVAPTDPRQKPKFLYIPDLPEGPYHDPYLQPWATQLQEPWEAIRDEALALLAEDRDFESFLGLQPGQKAPEYVGGSNPNASWDAFFFYRHGQRYDANHLRCPVTSGVLESIELCRIARQAPEACFSVIRPQSTIVRHYGVTNSRLVMHLPLIVPPGCALNVIDAGEHHWKPGELMMFDDTFQHEAWNHSDQPRLIVLMDCWNPHLSPPEQQAVKLLVEAIDRVEN